MLLAYQSGGQTTNGAAARRPAQALALLVRGRSRPCRRRQDNPWESADNYNYSRPFSAIDDVAVAVPADLPDGS